MKKSLFFLLALFLSVLSWQGTAQVTIGDGTATQRFPLGNWFGFERSAAIYTASEILSNGNINSVAWYATTGGQSARPIKIYLKQTTATTESTGTWASKISGATLVYDGLVTPVVGWNTFNLSTPFPYTSNNLEVLVEANFGGGGTGGSGGSAIRYSSKPNSHVNWTKDTSPPTTEPGSLNGNRPNIRLGLPAADGCSGTPNGGIATITPSSGGTDVDVVLSATGYSTGYTGLSFQWEYRFNQEPFINFGNPTSSYIDAAAVVTGSTGDMLDIRLKVTCTNSQQSAYSTIATYEFVPAYCTPKSTNTSDYLSSITSVGAVTNIAYSASSIPTGGYADRTSVPFQSYETQNFDINTTYVGGGNGVNIWVDWNNDMDFDETEKVASLANASASKTLSVTVPAGTPQGNYRMRIRSLYGSSANPAPCGSIGYGSAVDFNLNIVAPPSCLPPTELALTDSSSSSASFSWTTPAANSDLYITLAGDPAPTPNSSPTMSGVSSPTTINGLDPNTAYSVYVRADCGNDGISAWSGALNFRTPCGSVESMFENFDSYDTGSTVPTCWTRLVPASSAGSMTISSTTPASGTRNIYQYAVSTSNPIIVVLPYFSNISDGTHWLRFKARVSSGAPGTLQVGYVTNDTDYSSFTVLENLNIINTSYTANAEYTVAVPNTVPNNARIAIKNMNDAKSYYWDDVYWEVAPTCLPPSHLAVTSVSSSSVDFSWTTPASTSDVYITLAGDPAPTPNSSPTVSNVTSPTTINGLDQETAYSIYVRANCGSEGLSSWAGPLAAYTGYCISVPTSNDNNGITHVQVGSTNYVGSDVTYLDFTGEAPGELAAGITSNVQITFDTGYGYDTHVWIDLNDNLEFEPSELMFSGESSNARPNTLDASFTMPANAPMGIHRMRIGTADSGQSTPDPCYNGSYGVTVDLNVDITAPPSCLPPTALAITSVGSETADISWTAGDSETSWNISWGAPGYTPGVDDLGTGAATSQAYQITGLMPNTSYEVFLQADCDGDVSNWVGPVQFMTPCIPGAIPFNEGFEYAFTDAAPLDGCWSQSGVKWLTRNQNDTYGRTARTGDSYIALIYGSNDWIFHPLNLTGGTTYDLSFYARQDATSGASVKASFGTGNTVADMINEIIPVTQVTSDEYEKVNGTFTPVTDGVYYIGINGTTNYAPWYLTLDDISVVELQCTSPEMTLAVQDANGGSINCLDAGGEYYVLATLSGGEGNTSYNVSANGGDAIEVNADDSVVLGPFTVGTDVSVTAVGAQDEACSVSASIDSPAFCLPSNDEACGATVLACGDVVTQSLLGATASIEDNCFGTGSADVWFTFIADGTQSMTVAETSSLDAIVHLFMGDDCGNLQEVGACKDFPENYTVTEEGTYYFRVRPYSSSGNTGTISVSLTCVDRPTNENCDSAIVLECNADPVTYSSVGSTAVAPVGCDIANYGLWFSFAGTGADITINSTANFDHEMSILTGSCGELTSIACRDSSTGAESYTVAATVANQMYYVYVAHYSATGTTTGNITIGIDCAVVPECTSPEMTLAVQDANGGSIDCLDFAGEYFVLATLSGGEGNTSYNVSANGGDVVEVDADDSVVLGPFTRGTNVNVTATGAQDGDCSVSASINSPGLCPPVNDDCDGAIALVCGETITGSTVGATASGLSATCGSYTSSSALDLFYSFEADGTSSYTVSLNAAPGYSFDGVLFVYSGTCGNLTSLGCSDSGNPEEMVLDAPAAGTYTVRIFNYFGTGEFTLGLECIAAPECTSPEMTLAVQDANGGSINCLGLGGEFYVLATLSGGEGNTSYNVSANGGDVVEVDANDSVLFGPFSVGTDVDVTAVGVQDDVCSVMESVDSPGFCPPANDDCIDAIALSCGDSIAGTTVNATNSGMGLPTCANGTPNDVFYTLAVQQGNEYTVSVVGADYDGVLVLYSGVCGQLTEIDCADNGFSAGVEESITFTASATETITIRTYDWSPSQGSFTISVTCEDDPSIPASEYFVTTWTTTTANETITIPTSGSGYDYLVEWGDGSSDTGVTGNATHAYAEAGTYTVKIHGDFPRIYFNLYQDRQKIQSIEQWGNIQWTSMNSAFMGATHLVSNASDMPNLSMVTDMYGMFGYAEAFNGDSGIGSWDVSNVTNMYGMFGGAFSFNADISNWDVGNVRNMKLMFSHAYSFNQDIGNWDVGSVTNMDSMFRVSSDFDQDLGGWNVSNVVNMTNMLKDVTLSTANYDALLNGWNTLTLKNNVKFHAGNSTYCNGEIARQNIIATFNWTIIDGGLDCGGNGTRVEEDNNKTLADITLYPNPMRNKLILGNPKNVQLESASIYDLTGRLITTVDLRGMTSEKEMDVSVLSSATYMVIVNGQNGGQVSKLMVKE